MVKEKKNLNLLLCILVVFVLLIPLSVQSQETLKKYSDYFNKIDPLYNNKYEPYIYSTNDGSELLYIYPSYAIATCKDKTSIYIYDKGTMILVFESKYDSMLDLQKELAATTPIPLPPTYPSKYGYTMLSPQPEPPDMPSYMQLYDYNIVDYQKGIAMGTPQPIPPNIY